MSEKVNGEMLVQEIEHHLEALDFVTWDRFTAGSWSEELDYITVYGWIDRPDSHEDYVEIVYWDNGHRMFTTSSEKHTEDIFEELFDEPLENHNDCKRVENAVNIDNVVEL